MSDAYTDLGLRGPLEDMTVIKAVFNKLKTVHHPDKGGDPQKFDRIMKAWEVLSDPEKKSALDAQLRAAEPAPPRTPDWTAPASPGGYQPYPPPTARGGTATAERTTQHAGPRTVAEEHPWAGEALAVTAARSRAPWWAPAVAATVLAGLWITAVSTVQSPSASAVEMFGDPSFSALRLFGVAVVVWVLILLLIPSVLPVAVIVTAVTGAAVVALFGADYPVAHGLAVVWSLAALSAVWWSRTRFTAIRGLYLHGDNRGAVLGAPASPGDEWLGQLASTIAATTAGAWSGEHLSAGATPVHLVFVGRRAGVLISAAHVPLPSRVLGGSDWQRVAAALNTADLIRVRKVLTSRGFAPMLYAVTGPGTGGSETVALDKHTSVTILSPRMASAVIGSALVLNQPVVTRRPIRIAAAVNKMLSR